MSNPQQPPADGWQPPQSPPQQEEQPVYRPNEQPPAQEPPPWSPESQRLAQPGSQQPVEDEGTVKYSAAPQQGHPSQPQAPFGPPPGVPVSPFDAPQPGPPVSGMPAHGPVSGMPPVSSVPASGMPASGMPVSPGQGQFGPQGGHLVPVSSQPGGQPWGGAQPGQIQRKKKKGGRAPLWILLVGIAVIAGALGVGGFILFNPNSGEDDPGNDPTVTIEEPAPEPELAVVRDDESGLSFQAGEEWVEDTEIPAAFTGGAGVALEDGTASAYVGMLDAAGLGLEADAGIGTANDAFGAAMAAHLGGEAAADPEVTTYRVDARAAEFRLFDVDGTTVLTALIETDAGYAGFAGIVTGDQVEAVEALRTSLAFGE